MNALRSRIRLGSAGLIAAALAIAALSASTDARAGAMASCPVSPLSQPFQSWSDTGSYFLGPGGAFEGTLTGWTARGPAKIVPGNEPYYVHSTSDRYSVSLPGGSSVTSPSVCVTTSTPDLRLFVLNSGAASSKLNVNMTYTNAKGQPSTVTVASLTGSSKWSLIPAVYFLQSIAPLVNGSGQTWVTFTFAATGGAWQIDDFYVDPMKGH